MNERLSLPQILVRKLPKGALFGMAGLGLTGGLAGAACGPVRGEVQLPVAAAPAQASELSTPTAVPTEVKPTVTPTESPKPLATPESIPASQLPERLDSLMVSINSLSSPLSPRISQEQFEQDKKGIASEIQRVKDELAKGNVEEARKIIRRTETTGTTTAISGLLNSIVNLGDPLQSKFVPQELKQKHDPMDKYIQKERVDPRTYDVYFTMIGILVATDSSYTGKG